MLVRGHPLQVLLKFSCNHNLTMPEVMDIDDDVVLIPKGRKRQRVNLGASPGGKYKWAQSQWMEASKWNPMYGDNADYYRRYHPRGDDSRAKYGGTWATASSSQQDARRADRMYGRGKFSLGRSLRKFGSSVKKGAKSLGLESVRKAGADAIRSRAISAIQGAGGYGGMSQGIRGRGSYNAPFSNSSSSMILGSKFGTPHFMAASASHDDGGLIISNQEFVTDVYGNSPGLNFESRRFAIQPADAQLFPMLSQFACNFERYELLQCVFHFETQLDAGIIQSSTGQVGDVMLYHHMDTTEPEYNSSTEFLVNQGSVGRVTKGLAHGVECDPAQLKGLDQAGFNYVRQFPADDVADKDHGYMQLAVSNTPADLADQVIGKLFVSYSVKLVKPRVHQSLGRAAREDTFAITKIQLVDADTSSNNVTDNLLHTSIREVRAGSKNNIGCELVTYTYPVGTIKAGSPPDTDTPVTIWGVRFPDDLMGYVRITCSMQFRDNIDTSVDPTSPRETFERFSEYVRPKAAGNVEIVEDRSNFQMISSTPNTGEIDHLGNGILVNLDISVRIGNALGGVGNYVMMDCFTADGNSFGTTADPPAHSYTELELWNAQSSADSPEHRAKGHITITMQSDKEYRGENGQYPVLLRSAELDIGKYKQALKITGSSEDVAQGVTDGKILLGDGANPPALFGSADYPDWVPGVSDTGYISAVV